MKGDAGLRADIPEWMEENMFVERMPADDKLRKYEVSYKSKLERILAEAKTNDVKTIQFGPENHR